MSETPSTPTPNNMPGAASEKKDALAGQPTPPAVAEPAANGGLSSEERAELDRLRTRDQHATTWERRAKDNFDDAERWRKLSAQAGGDNAKEFNPEAEFKKLRGEVESERTERIRSEVARTEGVDLDVVTGGSEDDMRASARRYKERLDAAVEAALKGRGPGPAAAPAAEVTSNGKVDGPTQITSRDELKNMTSKQIVEARNEGRLDQLLGKA